MCGVRKLTHTAYANQRMTLSMKTRQVEDRAEYDGRATWVIHVACFIIHVLSKAFGDAS